MILSQEQIFSSKQAILATILSTNIIDLGIAGTPYGAVAPFNRDIGKGTPIPVSIAVDTDFVGATSVTVTLETGATPALGTVLASETILAANLVIGKQLNMQSLPNGVTGRYLGLRYTVAGAATAGSISAGISMGNQTNVTGV